MVGGTFVRLRHPENLRMLDSVATILQNCNKVEQLSTQGSFGKLSAIIGNGLVTVFTKICKKVVSLKYKNVKNQETDGLTSSI
jgi:hypothetical protein